MTDYVKGGNLAAGPPDGVEPLRPEELPLLAALAGGTPPAPDRQRILAAAYAAADHTKEHTMVPNLITRIFAGKNPALRLALGGGLLLALVALSLLLPRTGSLSPAGTAYAATEGYLLAFDFGDQDMAAIQPVVDQLFAKVKAFKAAHGLPVGQKRTAMKIMESHDAKTISKHGGQPESTTEEQQRRAVVVVSLPDASLLDALKKELATIPGLPTPQLTDSTWFSQNGMPDPSQPGINLTLEIKDGESTKQHVFNFPDSATEQQIESEVNDWLTQNHPDTKFTVKVTLGGDKDNRTVEVRIEGKSEAPAPTRS